MMPLQWKKFIRQILRCSALVVSLLALVACGGGGGGGGGGSSSDPSVPATDFVSIVPTANPGPDQYVETGQIVQLDASSSTTSPVGGLLTYSWDMNLPANSSAVLLTPEEVTSSFTADVDGVYEIYLTVFDDATGVASDPVKTIIISENSYVSLFSIDGDGSALYESADGVYYLTGSQFYATITNDSELTFRITRAELYNGTEVISFTENQDFLGGSEFSPAESLIGVFVLNKMIKNDGFEFRYYISSPDTSETFIVRYLY
ncbi:PKD domain-containing protein [Pelovirga terrestris]|uniref:PKD domain-containing protein n=1 Tax=Pelovirga terrestris TaxID=2771352 RepID=A0A8J6QWV5_9BACT|nr:PKD domain-containing protein [Pelovirga terrestris]MBD1399537.1 PKD domain-containing protein [Pelovirga terrestris]